MQFTDRLQWRGDGVQVPRATAGRRLPGRGGA
jgi:hypothetical protein